jgi:hypothetical protein
MDVNGTLTRERILAAATAPPMRVEVPEWGGALWVRSISAGERDTYERRALEGGRRDLVRAMLVMLCAVDGEGRRLFSEADVELLAGRDAAPMHRVFDAACRLNRIGPQEVAELEQVSAARSESG